MNETRCKDCENNRKSDRFCIWLGAFLDPGVIGNLCDCEGFTSNKPCPKTLQRENAENLARPAQISEPSSTVCPKTQQPDRKLIQTVLSLKSLKGSIVRERVRCGKRCHCQSGVKHGPYFYLHFVSQGKVKRKYLTKAMSELLLLPEGKLAATFAQETFEEETEGD